MTNLTEAERKQLRGGLCQPSFACHPTAVAAVERIVTERQAQALEEAADDIKEHRRTGIIPEGHSHYPYSEGFESWLRARATELRGAPGQADNTDGDLVEEGRRLASERDDLIAAGVDPAELLVPLAPAVLCTCGHDLAGHTWRDDPDRHDCGHPCTCTRFTPADERERE